MNCTHVAVLILNNNNFSRPKNEKLPFSYDNTLDLLISIYHRLLTDELFTRSNLFLTRNHCLHLR